MKYRIPIFIYLILSTLMPTFAQLKELALDDLIPGGKAYSRFVPKNLKQLQWFGSEYIYQKGDSLYVGTPAKSKKDNLLLSLNEINQLFQNSGIKSLSTFPSIGVATQDQKHFLKFRHNKQYILLDPIKKKVELSIPFDSADTNFDFNPSSRLLAVTQTKSLYIIGKNGVRRCIGQDSNKNISFGANDVHRNEFGISKGTFWAPDGSAIAFYRMDETNVGNYPLVDISAREARLKDIKYPMAGMKSHEVTIGVYLVEKDSLIYLKTGTPKDRYFTNITWSPDSRNIYIQELNRRQDTCHLEVYDSHSGKHIKTLVTETSTKYIEPENPIIFLKNNPEQFIYQSKRSGYNHLYLYDINGHLIRPITSGEWSVTNVSGFDKTGELIIISSTEASPLQRNCYLVNLINGEIKRLTTDEGVHQIQINSTGEFLIDNYSAHNIARQITINSIEKGESKILLSATNPYIDYKLPTIESGTFKAADAKTDLYYRLIKPADLDPNKKYPVIIYVYGGPHMQQVTDSWLYGTRGWEIYMAQKGYILFVLDNRGSDGRGFDFESANFHQLGIEEAKDQVKGVEMLKSLSYVDPDRIGVHGWSYGGFMTTNLILRYPDIFKVGVAGGPVIDWKYYEIMYGERYMGDPKENEAGYNNSNLTLLAKNLNGRLLLIHGDEDPVVVWQHSLAFLKSCIEAGTYPDYFVYPGHKHNVIGKDRIHLHEKISRYFDDYLKR